MKRLVRVAARIPVIEMDDTGAAPYFTKNLSLGGLFLLTERRWPVGSTVRLTIKNGDKRLPISARVTHIQIDGVGFSFAAPPADATAALRGMIDEILAREGYDVNRAEIGGRAVWSQGDRR